MQVIKYFNVFKQHAVNVNRKDTLRLIAKNIFQKPKFCNQNNYQAKSSIKGGRNNVYENRYGQPVTRIDVGISK